MTKVRIVVLLGSAIALILVIWALQLLTPGNKIDQAGPGGAHIVYSIDYGMVFAPGACVTVRWQVDHIQKVFFDDQPTVGQGIDQVCADTQTLPVLHVNFQDNTSQDYALSIRFWIEQSSTWLLMTIGVLLGLIGLYVALSRTAVPFVLQNTPRMILIFAGIGMLVALISVAALVLELGLRLYFGQNGTLSEKESYLYSRTQIMSRKFSTVALPFLEFGLTPDYPGQNALGYRGEEIQIPKPEGVYRIVTLGDSSTYGALVPYDKTYSYDLQQVLRDDYGQKNIEVINGGVPGYSSWNILMDLAFRIPTLQPDLVIIYQGWLDVQEREFPPDCYSTLTPFLGLTPIQNLRALSSEPSRSALYRFLAIDFGLIENPATEDNASVPASLPCSPYTTDLAQLAENIQTNRPVYFERNLREEIAVAKANHIRLMLMTWAYNVNGSQVPVYRIPAIAEHNDITRQIAQENGVLLYDYAPIAPTDEAEWKDTDHMSIEGNQNFAQNIAQFLVDQGVIIPPPQQTS